MERKARVRGKLNAGILRVGPYGSRVTIAKLPSVVCGIQPFPAHQYMNTSHSFPLRSAHLGRHSSTGQLRDRQMIASGTHVTAAPSVMFSAEDLSAPMRMSEKAASARTAFARSSNRSSKRDSTCPSSQLNMADSRRGQAYLGQNLLSLPPRDISPFLKSPPTRLNCCLSVYRQPESLSTDVHPPYVSSWPATMTSQLGDFFLE